MSRKTIKPAGVKETAAFLLALVTVGSSLIALGIYALLFSPGDEVTRIALVFTATPVGLIMLYVGLGGFAVWLIEALGRRRARRIET